ncbi:MAG: DUF2793 domain-containing protein, partial [Pseudomonadota bacterium]
MSDTVNFELPLLASGQAQKHVTMNEALVRLDALSAPMAMSMDLSVPPAAAEGDAYIVADGASGDWTGHDGDLAFFDNGGWSFGAPRAGWRVWVADRSEAATWSGDRWVLSLHGGIAGGAYGQTRVLSGDAVLSGASSTGPAIPDRAVVIGVTARVIADIGGAAVTGFQIGVSGAEDRYGSGVGLVKDSTANGVTGAPVAYYADTPLVITAEGGTFDGGEVRL